MSRIKIKNFGPIKEPKSVKDEWIDIKKVTVFTGNQGSGKSTVAKLISTFTWMEKVLTRGDFKEKEFTTTKFKNKYCGYHRISNYFIKERTEIIYEGMHTNLLTLNKVNLSLKKEQIHLTDMYFHKLCMYQLREISSVWLIDLI